MKKIFLLVALISSLTTFAQNFSTQKGGHCYTLDLPNYLLKTYDLNDVATLQYMNTAKDAYVIVIEDSKDELNYLRMVMNGPTEFLEFFLKDYQAKAKKRKVSPVTTFESNGNNHAQVELSWEENGVKLSMLITVAESKSHFYKILCWTNGPNFENMKQDFLAISKSLKD